MDYAYRETDRRLAELEKKISEIYADASKELQAIIDDYFDKLVDRDEHQRELMEAGQITKEQYHLWRMAQIGRGERYIALQNEIAQRCNQANQLALSYVNDTTPGIYSLNYNYSAYTIEKFHGNVGFTLFDEQTVRRLLADDPELLPAPRIDIPLDLKWNKQKLQRELITGIMLGESSSKLATRFQSITDMNRVSAIRNARTALTGAQNAGRQESYIRAAEMGIKVRKRWVAIKDGRTRHSHGMLDAQTVDIDEFFVSENGSKMLYPGDRNHGADPCDVYNCRCGMRTAEKEGIEAEPRQMRVKNPETGEYELISDMSYPDWIEWKEKLEKNKTKKYLAIGTEDGTMERKIEKLEVTDVQKIADIDISKYSVIAPDIRSSALVLTNNQKEHIIKRRGQGFFDTYSAYFGHIAEDPDYIFPDKAHPNTAIACKTLEVGGANVHLVIRLAVQSDDLGLENSVITVLVENNKRYAQRLRNNIPLYKKE